MTVTEIALPQGAGLKTKQPRRGLLRRAIDWQKSCSEWLDRRLPDVLQLDGNRDFLDRLVGEYLTSGLRAYDVGGGKNPVISGELKSRLGLHVVGLDVSRTELEAAPPGAYDELISVDIARHTGGGDGDLVICQALLEHVEDPDGAIRAIASILKPGGRALLFVPSRNAVFARLNLLLPQALKRLLLFAVFPEMGRDHGFPAYYRCCTPAGMRRLGELYGLVCERELLYYRSDYFRFCFPLHAIWRLWVALFRTLSPGSAAETFTLVLRKPEVEAVL